MNHKKPIVLQEFIRRAGGENVDVVIFPQPSILKDTGNEYARLFLDLGARATRSLEFRIAAGLGLTDKSVGCGKMQNRCSRMARGSTATLGGMSFGE